MSPEKPTGRRRYDSPLRTAQAAGTRQAVLAAATALFEQRGWAATSMRDVARAAGVSVETIYTGFGSKSELLKQALDVAVAGDDDPVPVMERPAFAALGQGGLQDRLTAGAVLVTETNRRTARLVATLREAARADAELAERHVESRRQHRDTARAALSRITAREVAEPEADGIWAIASAEVYELLTREAGWDDEQYQTWVAGVMGHLLGASANDTSGTERTRT